MLLIVNVNVSHKWKLANLVEPLVKIAHPSVELWIIPSPNDGELRI